jgi:DNA-binding MarR family transcriptional regulator
MDERVEVARRLHSAAIHLLRHARQVDGEAGLTPARLSAMSVLVFGGPMTLTDLARIEQVKAPTMTRIVQALEEDKLIERRPHEQDQRMLVLHATKRGDALLRAAQRRRVELIAHVLSRLDERGVRNLDRAARDLDSALTAARAAASRSSDAPAPRRTAKRRF